MSHIITEPGKFEGEPTYVPYFWEQVMDGMADDEIGRVSFFIVGHDDRKKFPHLKGVYGVALEESEQGFVYHEDFDSLEEYNATLHRLEREEGDDTLD